MGAYDAGVFLKKHPLPGAERASVFRVLDDRDDAPKVLKQLDGYADSAHAERERTLLRRLEDCGVPGVARLDPLDGGGDDRSLLLQLARGEYLAAHYAADGTPPQGGIPTQADAVKIGVQCLETLEGIHGVQGSEAEGDNNRLVHGRITPDHLIWDGGAKQLTLVGFGSATARTGSLTTPSPRLRAYWPPDREYQRLPSVGDDLFAVGVLLWELLLREHPYEDRQPRRDRTPERRTLGHCPEAVEDLLRSACSAVSEARFTDARSMRNALTKAARPLFVSEDKKSELRRARDVLVESIVLAARRVSLGAGPQTSDQRAEETWPEALKLLRSGNHLEVIALNRAEHAISVADAYADVLDTDHIARLEGNLTELSSDFDRIGQGMVRR